MTRHPSLLVLLFLVLTACPQPHDLTKRGRIVVDMDTSPVVAASTIMNPRA